MSIGKHILMQPVPWSSISRQSSGISACFCSIRMLPLCPAHCIHWYCFPKSCKLVCRCYSVYSTGQAAYMTELMCMMH